MVILGLCLIGLNVTAESVAVQTTGNFKVELPANTFVGPYSSGIAFQPSQTNQNYIIVIVASENEAGELRGGLNGTACSVWFLKGGCFQFMAETTAWIRIGGNASKITVQGDQYYKNAETFTSSTTYNILLNVVAGDKVTISWDIYPEVGTIPVMLIIGVAGFLFVFFGILVTLYKMREHDWEWIFWGFLIVLVGICLVIAWLWS